MRELRVFGRTVPVFLAGGNNNNISWGNRFLFSFCGDNPFSESDYQDWLAVVRMKFVANPLPKFTTLTLNS